MTKFPIEAIKSALLDALETQATIILSAPPGAGKSTVLPLWLLDVAKFHQQKIYLLQPRRIAAKNIAHYLAKQLGERVGETIGYRLRNEIKVGAQTRLEVITEGILTQIIQNDAELTGCGLVIFDEFHQRSVQADIAFALARDIQQGLRDDLSLLLMSATLDNQYLMQQLPDAYPLQSEGRSFAVSIEYLPPKRLQYWREHALAVIKTQLSQHQGSILVFVAGVGDIHFLVEGLTDMLPTHFDLLPLYGDMSLSAQQQVIAPAKSGRYKLVIATNIAETSLTIEGINLVIDCGFENIVQYNSHSLLNQLQQKQICKASTIQRTGRAGRVMAGHCLRLYSKDDFERRAEQSVAEIQRADLLPCLIEAARWGVTALADLPLLTLPNTVKEQQAWQELITLNIVNQQHKLTQHGEQVAKLNCHPRFAHMLLMAKQFDRNKQFVLLACYIAALLEEKDLYSRAQAQDDCDLRHRLIDLVHHRINDKHLVQRIKQQAARLAKQLGIQFSAQLETHYFNKTGVLLALAYPERVAKARSREGEFVAVNGKGFSLAVQDKLSDEAFIVAAQLMQLKSQRSLMVKLATAIELSDIYQLFNDKIHQQTRLIYHEKNDRISTVKQTILGNLVLEQTPSKDPASSEQIAHLWTELLKQKGLSFKANNLFTWQAKVINLIKRWQWLVNVVKALELPTLSEHYLLENLDVWFTPFVGEIKSKAQLANLNFMEMLLTLLSYDQQQLLNKLAPAYYISPTGRRFLISYEAEQQSPKVALPMQEVYGLAQTPHVAGTQKSQGIPLVLELLSPAGRPIQTTADLEQFWQGSYKAVQKDMKSRYPKHYWPDDPAHAKASRHSLKSKQDK